MSTEFVGNFETKNTIVEWLNIWYHKGNTGLPLYAILFGTSGNGKTFLPTILSDMFGVELVRITPFDIQSMNDLYDFIKTINSMTLEGTSYKLILIDDIDEYPAKYQTILFEEAKTNKYPIIFTSTSYSFPQEVIDKSLKHSTINTRKNIKKLELLKVEKPLTSELLDHLKKKAKEMNIDISDLKLSEIAQQSTSVRSAEMSLYNLSVNDFLIPSQTRYEFLHSISERKLSVPINRSNIDLLFSSIKDYSEKALKVKAQVSDFDYRIRAKFEEIEPFFVNDMIESIDQIKLQLQYDNKERIKGSERISIDKPKEEEKKKEIDQPSLDKWGI